MDKGLFEDLRVIELSSVLAGPATGMFFAESGAEVIKVEHPGSGGDVTRQWKTESESEETDISSYFSSVNWGKKSIAIDLKSLEGLEMLYQLVQKADIVITSYKPGDAQKLGVDYETLKQNNPQLIYGAITGFGPEDNRVGYDAVIQAQAGFTYMNGHPDGPPTKLPVAFMDLMAAHQLKEGLLKALYKNLKKGEGSFVSVSLIQAGIASLANQATNWLVGGQIPERQGSEHPNIFPYGCVFSTKDQKVMVLAVGNDQQFEKLCHILQLWDIPRNPAYQTNPQRVKHKDELRPLLANAIAQWSRDPLLKKLHKAQIPAGAVLNMKEALEQPAAQEMLLHSSKVDGIRTIAFKPSPNPDSYSIAPPPHFGEHTKAILQNTLGYDEGAILQWSERTIIA